MTRSGKGTEIARILQSENRGAISSRFTFLEMGAAESSQCVNYDIFQKDGSFSSPFDWELHHAKSKVDGSFVSIFQTSVKSMCASNA